MSSVRVDDASLMIRVTKAWKAYDGSQYILKDLSISVPEGSIYSLLGSSGVGKTTLLNCINGNIRLDSGCIRVNVKSRLQIGYMPQKLALYAELTLKETFQFFGIILNMSNEELSIRTQELSDLLQLPTPQTQISTLSGGQQRRVSVGVAMLNNPRLIILDEPTADLDPILKQSIWSYLQRITRDENKTVLLTTHYIQEASNSDLVGFMANGRILLESSPAEALASTVPSSKRLEQVYYQLCSREAKVPQDDQLEELPLKSQQSVAGVLDRPSAFSLTRVYALFLKSIFYIRRNLLIFYVFLFSPALMTSILSSALQRPHDIKVGFVNLEDECLTTYTNCSTPLSCRYMENLKDKQFHLVKFDSVDEGMDAVRLNQVWGLVRFNWNFSAGVVNRMEYFYAAENVEIGDDDEARVWLDMSAHPISYMMKKHFYDSFLKSIEDWYTDCGWNTKAAHPIIRIEKPIFGEMNENLITSGIPTSMMMMMFATGVALGLIFVLTDRELGTFERCRVSGLKTTELVVSAFILCFVSLIPTGIALMMIMYLYCGPYNSPMGWTLLLLYSETATGILLGSLIGLTTTNLAKALQLTTGIMGSLLYMSGMLWPLEGAHWLIKVINQVFPSLPQAESIRIMSVKGFDVWKVSWGVGHSLLWLILLVVLVTLLSRRNEKR